MRGIPRRLDRSKCFSSSLLWKLNLGGQASSTPITYGVDGKQYVSMSIGRSVFVFGLRD